MKFLTILYFITQFIMILFLTVLSIIVVRVKLSDIDDDSRTIFSITVRALAKEIFKFEAEITVLISLLHVFIG